jgi:hypothetical protein
VTRIVIGIEIYKTVLFIVLLNMLPVVGHRMNKTGAEITFHLK